MQVADTSMFFINQELWVYQTTPTPQGSSSDWWIEAGITYGRIHTASGTVIPDSPHYFWVDQKGGEADARYEEHDQGPATLGASRPVIIDARTTTSWHINNNGHEANSANQFSGPAHYIATGAESTNTTNVSEGSSKNLQFRDLSGNWHNKWESDGAAGKSVRVPADSPMYSRWVDPQWWMQSGQLASEC